MEVFDTQCKGKGVRAVKNIKMGEVLLVEKAFCSCSGDSMTEILEFKKDLQVERDLGTASAKKFEKLFSGLNPDVDFGRFEKNNFGLHVSFE